MPENIKQWLRTFLTHLFTGADNQTFDIGRVMWMATAVWPIALETWDVVINRVAFNAQTFGLGMAAILAGGGIGVAAKAAAEPRPK